MRILLETPAIRGVSLPCKKSTKCSIYVYNFLHGKSLDINEIEII